jgi:hypothetical protein
MTRRSHNRSPCCGGLSATIVIEQLGLAIGRPDFACREKSMAGAHLSASDSAEELFSPTAAPARMNRCIRSAIFRPRMIYIVSKASASCIDCSDLDSKVNRSTFCRGQGKMIPRDLVLRGIVDQSNIHQMKRGTEAARAISLVSSGLSALPRIVQQPSTPEYAAAAVLHLDQRAAYRGGNQVVGGSQ